MAKRLKCWGRSHPKSQIWTRVGFRDALLATKTGGGVREKKEKKVKKRKYILMQHAIPVADGQVQAIRRLGPGPSPRGSRVFLGYARTKRFCLTQNRIKEEESLAIRPLRRKKYKEKKVADISKHAFLRKKGGGEWP